VVRVAARRRRTGAEAREPRGALRVGSAGGGLMGTLRGQTLATPTRGEIAAIDRSGHVGSRAVGRIVGLTANQRDGSSPPANDE
jgi:hypothetical protein